MRCMLDCASDLGRSAHTGVIAELPWPKPADFCCREDAGVSVAFATLAAMTYIIPAPAITSLPITGSDARFPIRRVFCIGRNYAEHAREMGATVDKTAPMFFCKPADAVVSDGANVPYPQATAELHHEVEMVVALGTGGRDLAPVQAAGLVWGYGVGLDLTRRDLQAVAKTKGHPWDVAKAFDYSAPVSALVRATSATITAQSQLRLSVNGEQRQQTLLGDMLHDVPHILAALSTLFTLMPGDLVFTGTPAGVAALQRGDRFHAELVGVADLRGRIV
jgi:fumarylpyruvate hydrolase